MRRGRTPAAWPTEGLGNKENSLAWRDGHKRQGVQGSRGAGVDKIAHDIDMFMVLSQAAWGGERYRVRGRFLFFREKNY